jgi:phosphonate transport system substrate-binding protein
VTNPDSGITDLSGVAGRSFAYSDPASTSGHLYPAFALKSNGIDPDTGVQAIYAGSHTSAYEALRNRKVDAGELNSDRIATARAAGEYSPDDWITLWKSAPIPQDPITVRGNLPVAFKSKIRETLLSFDFRTLSPDVQAMFKSDVAMAGNHLVADDDSYFDEIRSLVSTLNVDLSSL